MFIAVLRPRWHLAAFTEGQMDEVGRRWFRQQYQGSCPVLTPGVLQGFLEVRYHMGGYRRGLLDGLGSLWVRHPCRELRGTSG